MPALPVGSADGHMLPPVLSTVGSADSRLLPPVLSTTIGRHTLKRPRSAFANPSTCAAGTSPERKGMVGAIKAPLKGELSPYGD